LSLSTKCGESAEAICRRQREPQRPRLLRYQPSRSATHSRRPTAATRPQVIPTVRAWLAELAIWLSVAALHIRSQDTQKPPPADFAGELLLDPRAAAARVGLCRRQLGTNQRLTCLHGPAAMIPTIATLWQVAPWLGPGLLCPDKTALSLARHMGADRQTRVPARHGPSHLPLRMRGRAAQSRLLSSGRRKPVIASRAGAARTAATRAMADQGTEATATA